MPDRTALTQWLRWTIAAAGLLVAVAAPAATRYVSDQLTLNMRAGPGIQYKIEKQLVVGTKVDSLSHAHGWTRIRTSGGATGYVVTRLLTDQRAASARLTQLKKRVNRLESANATLKKMVSRALSGESVTPDNAPALVKQNHSLKHQLRQLRETSADALRISRENRTYRQRIMRLHARVTQLRHDVQALSWRRALVEAGGIVVFLALIVALIVPFRRGRRRRRSADAL